MEDMATERTKTRSLTGKVLPFIVVMTICFAVIISMSFFIKAKKQRLADQQLNRPPVEKHLTHVVTLEMVPELLEEKLNLPGVTRPWVSLDVVAEVTGKVIDKRAREGDRVKKGDVLAVIDKSDYQNAYRSALASWETAVASEKRLSMLVKKNFVTQSRLDDTAAMVKGAEASLDNARLNLERCTIVSPMDGVVDRIHIEPGAFLRAGGPVAQILRMDRIKVTVGIPESDVDAVRKLEQFKVTVDALNGEQFTGERHYLYKTADDMARLYNLDIRLDNPDGLILPDMFARVEIIKQHDASGLAVPMYALVSRGDAVGVFVAQNGVARFRPVKTGFQDGWKIQISKGLSPGDKVVVVGHRIIEDGESVHVARSVTDMAEESVL